MLGVNHLYAGDPVKRGMLIIISVLLILVGCLLFWPTPVDPVSWEVPATIEQPLNTKLGSAQRIDLPDGYGPEDVALDEQGRVYGGLQDGRIVRHDPATDQWDTFADTDGRPLGLHFDAQQNLIVCDAYKGLLSIDTDGNISVLSTEHNGLPFVFTDDLDIASDGKIYFTDASFKFGQKDWKLDAIEHRPNGRLLVYHPDTGKTELLLKDLYFANGVAVSPDDAFVLVNETWTYRVLRYWLKGPKQGTHDVFIDQLPGYPDGISCDDQGRFWLAIPSVRNALLDNLAEKPLMRKVVARLPRAFHPKPIRYAFVLGLDAEGQVTHNLQEPEGNPFAMITSVETIGNRLYLGSLHEPAYAYWDIP